MFSVLAVQAQSNAEWVYLLSIPENQNSQLLLHMSLLKKLQFPLTLKQTKSWSSTW
jgi:hypothetical protein